MKYGQDKEGKGQLSFPSFSWDPRGKGGVCVKQMGASKQTNKHKNLWLTTTELLVSFQMCRLMVQPQTHNSLMSHRHTVDRYRFSWHRLLTQLFSLLNGKLKGRGEEQESNYGPTLCYSSMHVTLIMSQNTVPITLKMEKGWNLRNVFKGESAMCLPLLWCIFQTRE